MKHLKELLKALLNALGVAIISLSVASFVILFAFGSVMFILSL